MLDIVNVVCDVDDSVAQANVVVVSVVTLDLMY